MNFFLNLNCIQIQIMSQPSKKSHTFWAGGGRQIWGGGGGRHIGGGGDGGQEHGQGGQ